MITNIVNCHACGYTAHSWGFLQTNAGELSAMYSKQNEIPEWRLHREEHRIQIHLYTIREHTHA